MISRTLNTCFETSLIDLSLIFIVLVVTGTVSNVNVNQRESNSES